jgi:hypothetical protein
MSGGTTFAKEVLDPAAFPAAAEACRYFGLPQLADLIGRIAVMDDDDELEMNDEYGELVPLDEVLADAFERRYATTAGDFDPVDMTS